MTLDEATLVVSTATPSGDIPKAKATTAAPPPNTAAVLFLRFITIPGCSRAARDAPNAALALQEDSEPS
ncbi:hypothetical protein [Mycobacterium sp.]|uniref:hypothetical protein n=1 Tax=Mycobacterium sp. TaxID=1785 RepID=UPI003C790D20